MATDVEIERSLNALSVTLNDQRLDRLDLGRIQSIVTGALGGEPHLRVLRAGSESVWIEDAEQNRVGRAELGPGPEWQVERCAFPEGGGVHATEAGSGGQD